jgi:hypothetical protein
MVLATAFVVSVAATFGRESNDVEYRVERDYQVNATWSAVVSMADAKAQAGVFSSLPATFDVNLNGVKGTVSVADNSGSLANSLLLTSTLTAQDGTQYAESAITAKYDYLTGSYWWTKSAAVTSNYGAWTWMMATSSPSGSFPATLLNYSGSDATDILSWLSTDGASYSGYDGNFEDGVVELAGKITIPTNNTLVKMTSDDGATLSIGADQWMVTLSSAGNGSVKVPTAGTYPIFIEYYNHQGGSGAAKLQLQWDSTGLGLGLYSAIPPTALSPLGQTWTFNGSAVAWGNGSELVNNLKSETGTAWLDTPQSISSFHAAFDLQFVNPVAQGLTFCIQNVGLSALGIGNGQLGYGGLKTSMCVKFDIHNNSNDSTGVYINGAAPTNPYTDIASSGVSLKSGDLIHCSLAYSGTTLAVSITDKNTGANYTGSFTVNIPGDLGATTGYVGFTSSTGTGTSVSYAFVENLAFGP